MILAESTYLTEPNQAEDRRAYRLLARLRGRQLEMARRGAIEDSARFAHRARRVSRIVQPGCLA